MQYVLLANNFGNLNTYYSPDKVGANGSVQAECVDVSSGSLQKRLGDTQVTLSSGVWTTTNTYVPSDSQTIVPWKTGAIGMSNRYSVASFGGRLYRSPKGEFLTTPILNGIQYTSDENTPPTWDYLGLFTPGTPTFAVASAGSGSGLQPDTYTYYCTFYNDLDQESPPITATVTLSTARDVTVTLPKAYTTATFANGDTVITVASNSKLRIGQRITGIGIQSGTYITAMSGTSVTISKPTTAAHSGSGNNIIDAQIVGTRVYRQGNGVTTPLLVQSTAIGTTSFTDSKANNQLGSEIRSTGTTDPQLAKRDISISESGILFCINPYNNIEYCSLISNGIWFPENVIKVSSSPLTSIYALDRFIFPTTTGAFFVTLDDATAGIPVVQNIESTEPCQLSAFVYAIKVGNEVWWNTNKGIVSTDGLSIRTVTKYIFKKDTSVNFATCYGVEYFDNEYFAILKDDIGASLYKFTRENGWLIHTRSMSTTSPGAIGFHIGSGCLIYTGNSLDSPASVRKIYSTTSRTSVNGTYQTGDWVGEKHSSLKKFRKISALFKGSITVYVYVDGSSTATPVGGFSGTNATTTRTSWWLPSETKGRAINLKVVLTSADAEVEELGIWVGEQREPMP